MRKPASEDFWEFHGWANRYISHDQNLSFAIQETCVIATILPSSGRYTTVGPPYVLVSWNLLSLEVAWVVVWKWHQAFCDFCYYRLHRSSGLPLVMQPCCQIWSKRLSVAPERHFRICCMPISKTMTRLCRFKGNQGWLRTSPWEIAALSSSLTKSSIWISSEDPPGASSMLITWSLVLILRLKEKKID